VGGALGVTGPTTLSNSLNVAGDANVNAGKFVVSAANGNTSIAGMLGVAGPATLGSTLGVAGDVNVNAGKFSVNAATGDTAIIGVLNVFGATTLRASLDVTGITTLRDSVAVTNGVMTLGNSANPGRLILADGSSGDQVTIGLSGVPGAPKTFLVPASKASGDTFAMLTDITGGTAAGSFTTLASSGLATLHSLAATNGATVGQRLTWPVWQR